MQPEQTQTETQANLPQNLWQTQRRNSIYYAVREGCFAAATLFISGTLIQLFLSQRGVSTVDIGAFNTVLCVVSVSATMAFSDVAERRPNALRQNDRVVLILALIFALYLPLLLLSHVSTVSVWLVVMAIASVQIVLASYKGVLDYKMLYQIIDIERYGAVASMTGVSIGLFGMGYSWLFSQALVLFSARAAFLMGFLSSALLVLVAYVCNRKMAVIHDPFLPQDRANHSAKTKLCMIIDVLRQPEFRTFIVPNTLRGVTIGVVNSLVLVALELGVSAKTAASLAMAGSIGYLLGSLAYHALSRVMRPKYLGLLGAGLLCAVILLPFSGIDTLFLIVAAVGYMGRTLVDYAVPSMVFQLIDPAVSGVYNAWRTVLFSVAAAATSYLVGALLGRVPTVALLIVCAAAYLICAIWYFIATRRFIKNPASDEGGILEN